MQPGHTGKLPQRFSRKSLHIITFTVALMILLLSQTQRQMNLNGPEESLKTEDQSSLSQEDTLLLKSTSSHLDGESKTPQPSDTTELKGLTSEALETIRSSVKQAERPTVSIDIKQWEHDTGAQLLFVESPEIPMLDIKLTFDAGSARDANLPGLARITSHLIGEGTHTYTVDEIAQRFEELGSIFSTFSARDMGIASLRTLTAKEHLEPSLELFKHIVSEPSFPEDALDRVKNTMKLGLEQAKASPRQLISQATWATLYKDHPYANHPGGTEASLSAITQKDIRSFHNTFYTQSNLTVAIVGAINWETAQNIAKEIIQSLPVGKAPAPLPPVNTPKNFDSVHIPFPSQQTHIRLATLSTTQNDPELVALTLANDIFGGSGFASILNKVIRQDNGLAYSVYSHISPMHAQGSFIIDLQTKNENASKALSLTRTTLQEYVQNGPDSEQIQKAKNNIIAGFPLGIATNGSILGQISYLGFYDLPMDSLQTYTEDVQNVSQTQLITLFRKHIGEKPMLMITLGPDPIDKADSDSESEVPSS